MACRGRGEVGGVVGDDALGVQGQSQAVRVGLVAEPYEEVVLCLEYPAQTGKGGPVSQPHGCTPAAAVDGVVRFAVSGVRGADDGCSAEQVGFVDRFPVGNGSGVAAVEPGEGPGDLGGVLEDGHGLGVGQVAVAQSGSEVVFSQGGALDRKS